MSSGYLNAHIEEIRKLNAKLKLEEERVKTMANNINRSLGGALHNKIIDDCNFNCRLAVFSKDADCYEKHDIDKGCDPFYEMELSLFDHDTECIFFYDNWNLDRTDHPLAYDFLCYSMHCMLFYAHELSWQDVLAIDRVWIDLKVDYRFIINL